MPLIAHVVLDSAAGYACGIKAGRHLVTADEPATAGGTDTGPCPYQLVLSGLAACTAITLRMYAERKGWALGAIAVDLEFHKEAHEGPALIRRVVTLEEPLADEQRTRLAEIAEKTPVTKTLKGGVSIETEFR